MDLKFTKMNGLGNDLVVIDAINQSIKLTENQCKTIADRRLGIGCDQILLVERPTRSDSDFFFRIFNADGSEAGQCGNGARCFARFVKEKGLSDKDAFRVDTISGLLELYLADEGQVRVNIGIPEFRPKHIPMVVDQQATSYPITANGHHIQMATVAVGNPHAVTIVDSVDIAPVEEIGQALQAHPQFPEKANVEFMEICSRDRIKLRIYERGSAETMACGSGACGAVAAGINQQLLNERVTVSMPGGELYIEWQGGDHPLWMTGPTATVFEGSIEL